MLGLGNSLIHSSYQWQPTSVGADLKLWLRNGVGVSAAAWDDSSGSGNDMEQGDLALQGVEHEGGIDFTGSEDHHYDISGGGEVRCDAQEPFMIFIVCIFDSFDDQNSILGTGDNNVFLEFQTNRKLRFKTNDGGTADVDSLEYPSGTFATGAEAAVFGIQREEGGTGNVNLYKNGTLIVVGEATTSGKSMTSYSFHIDLKRGDYIQIAGRWTGTSSQNGYYIKRL